MSYIDANGIRLHVQELNPEGRETVILLHGLLVGSLAMWYFTAAPFLSEKYRVIMYDLRGHGKSDSYSSGFDIDSLVSDLEALIDHYQLERVNLAGHSYGGLIALHCAMKHPELVDRLVVIDAPYPPSDVTEINDFIQKSPGQMVEALPEWMRQMVAGGKRQAVRLVKSLEHLCLKSTLLTDLRNEKRLTKSQLAAFSVPTLLMYGDASSCFESGKGLAGQLPGSTFTSVPGGHYLPIESVDIVKHTLMEFFCGSR